MNPELYALKVGFAEMLKGGVILDVTSAEQARIAEGAGAAAVMALERVPADIRREGGVARMAAVEVIEGVRAAVSIPVMAKCRIGHLQEARLLETLGVDFIDESEVLTPADEEHHVDKSAFRAPFVCGARDLGEALRRIAEGAALIRTKGEAGSGNIVEAVRHLRRIGREIRALAQAPRDELMALAKELGAPFELVLRVAQAGALPVPNFAAGGIATPADAALCMSLGAQAVFVGSGIFKSSDPEARARAIVRATTHWDDPKELLEASRGLGPAMPGLALEAIPESERLAPARLVSAVGILALQGDFAAHAGALTRAGMTPRLVRTRDDMAQVAALILPGGESSAMLHGIERDGLEPTLRAFLASGRPVLGTCAGAILLAREVRNPAQRSLGALDIDIERNAYGTQLDSFNAQAEVDDPCSPFAALACVLIRAPRIGRVGDGVSVHARVKGDPVLVSCGPIWAATFHPELGEDLRVLRAWIRSAP